MALNNLQRIVYQSLTEKRVVDQEGQSFEDFFVDVARRLWGDDFEPVRAYGKHGDLKCDGRRISTGGIYQCYAPRGADSSEVHKKIKNDFDGALSVWKDRMKSWSIVVNDRQGLDALATLEVEALRKANPEISIKTVLPSDLVKMVLALDIDDLAGIFTIKITEQDTVLSRVTFSDLGAVIDTLSGIDPAPSLASIGLPATNKIEVNSLGPEIAALLRQGDLLASHVDSYFQSSGRVEIGERLSEVMKLNYRAMKAAGNDPTQCFFGIVSICGGLDRPKNQTIAVLAVVAYYFHKCDIFENA